MAKKESLVVGSKVRAYIRSKKCLVSGELLGAVSDGVYAALDKAVERCKSNKRSTVRPQDV